MMNKTLLSLAAAAALATTPFAQAADFIGVATPGPVVVEDYSSDDLISFDIDFGAVTSATLSYRIGAADVASMGLGFNAVLRNLAGSGFSGYTFSLSKGGFEEVGSVTRQFGGSSQISFNGNQASVRFTPLEFLDVEIGDPLVLGGNRINWAIDGLVAGDRLSITVSAVPEPGTYALLLAGLLAVAFVVRRRG